MYTIYKYYKSLVFISKKEHLFKITFRIFKLYAFFFPEKDILFISYIDKQIDRYPSFLNLKFEVFSLMRTGLMVSASSTKAYFFSYEKKATRFFYWKDLNIWFVLR